jgi:RHS repeat-associated protein
MGNEFTDTLDYMHARYYSPGVGRFLSVDRHLGHADAPQSWNRYSYALNNPISLLDPDGNAPRESRIIHIQVSVVYSNADRCCAPPFVMHTLRERTEAGLIQARQHYAQMGIALAIKRYEGNVLENSPGNINGNVNTPTGQVGIGDFLKSNVTAGGLTLIATPDVQIKGGSSATSIVNGVPMVTIIGDNAGVKDAEHEMAHSFGNTMGGQRTEIGNVVTDIVWAADRTQDDLFPSLGFSYWFEQELREGAAKLEDKKGH